MTSFFDRLSYTDVAKAIDHSLLRPELDDAFVEAGCKLAVGNDRYVEEQIAEVVEVAHAEGALVKVILENAYLTDEQKVRGCHLVEAAGADFVKTSTGFAPTGATIEDLKLMRRSVSPRIGVK